MTPQQPQPETGEDSVSDLDLFHPEYIVLNYHSGSIVVRKYTSKDDQTAHLFTADEILVRVEHALKNGRAVAIGALL